MGSFIATNHASTWRFRVVNVFTASMFCRFVPEDASDETAVGRCRTRTEVLVVSSRAFCKLNRVRFVQLQNEFLKPTTHPVIGVRLVQIPRRNP